MRQGAKSRVDCTIVVREMKPAERGSRRTYRMTRRREMVDTTRERIIQAALDLHGEIGPAYATISAVAERAGVERHTVYRHFPDLVSLFQACTVHGMATTGLPAPGDWLDIKDPFDRLRAALTAMYGYWRRNERLVANILRDMPVSPELMQGSAKYQDHLGNIWQSVLQPWAGIDGPDADRVRALIGTALEFGTWQAMTQRYGLDDKSAVDAMLAAVRSAATPLESSSAGQPA
jgi:AcrR family transcriptional regulator